MARIMAIDYGSKRVGIAVTDEQQIIATGLTTVHSKDVTEFLKRYFDKEKVECIVVGEPKHLNNEPSDSALWNTTFLNYRVINRSHYTCLLYTSPSPRDRTRSRMPSSA